MRVTSIQRSALIVFCLVAGYLILAAPAEAIGGGCSRCLGTYESCMETAELPQEETWCEQLTAACWNNCQMENYQYCGYTYSYCINVSSGSQCPAGCSSGATWHQNKQAKTCASYVSYGPQLYCEDF